MSNVPRYLGATAAAVRAALEAILTPEVYLREFDMNGDGAVASASEDEAALVAGVCMAERIVDVHLSASHGAPFVGAVPPVVVDIVAMLTPWCVMRWRNLDGGDKAPGRKLYDDAMGLLKALAADKQARIPERGAPAPTSALPVVVAADPFWGDACGGGF